MRKSLAFVRMISTVLLLATAAISGEKERDWQTGKVLDSKRSSYFAGTVGDSNTTGKLQTYGRYGTYQSHTDTSQTAVYRTYQTFVIEGQTHVYQVHEHLRWRWSRRAILTVNAPVKFAVEKRKLFVIDEDGKEREMRIVKRVLRVPEQPEPLRR